MKSTPTLTAAVLGLAFLGGLCGSAMFYLFMGPSSVEAQDPKVQAVVRAERVEIVDREGKLRVNLGVTEDGAGLGVFDPDGKAVLQLGQTSGLRGILLYDRDKALRLLLGVAPEGLTYVRLRSAQSPSHITMSTSSKAEPKIEIKNGQNQLVWSAP